MSFESNVDNLEIKNADKITFVGPSTSTVVDTVNGRVGIGTNTPSHTLDLRGTLNFQPTSNTAHVRYDSNVVTEFNRSKNVFKYPKVILTANGSNQGYTVSGSNEYNSNLTFYGAFTPPTRLDNPTGSWLVNGYSATTGDYTSTVRLHSEATLGEYVQIVLPERINPVRFTVQPRPETANGNQGLASCVREGEIWASNDSGTTWTLAGTIHNFTPKSLYEQYTVDDVAVSGYYDTFALIIHKNNKQTFAGVGEWKIFGTPEYDSDAHGTDVVVKSEANVPNTDSLAVYYDAKDLTTTPGTITDLSTNSRNGSINGNVTVSDGAFVFDGSGDYISTTLNGLTGGNLRYAVSTWIKMDRFGASNGTNVGYIYGLGNANANGQKTMVYVRQYNSGQDPKYQLVFAGYTYDYAINKNNWVLNKWYHIVVMHEGSDRSFSGVNAIAYVDGVRVDCLLNNVSSGGNAGNTLSIADNPTLTLGGNGSVESYSGSIANFRLFDRLLSDDEVHQLYAYQKEYFGHGDLSMTLKSGRLGIGTPEPRADLEVKGNVRIGGTIQVPLIISHRYISGNDTTVTSGNYIPFNGVLHEYPAGIHNGNYFTCPVKGIYECHADMLVDNGGNYDGNHEWHKNNAGMSPRRRGYGQQNSGNLHNQATSHYYIECDAGDTLSLMGVSTVAWYGSDEYSHSHMSIRLITAT